LKQYTEHIGHILRLFSTSIRVSSTLRENEHDELLSWFLLSSIYKMMDSNSPIYTDASRDLQRRAATAISSYFILIVNEITRINSRINKTEAEITYAIDSRNQAERERFIKKQDLLNESEKRADNLFKYLGIGPYSEGALKRNVLYDADYYEFHRNQRAEYGMTDFGSDITGVPQAEVRVLEVAGATVGDVGDYIQGEQVYD
jgi:hypothetical protein